MTEIFPQWLVCADAQRAPENGRNPMNPSTNGTTLQGESRVRSPSRPLEALGLYSSERQKIVTSVAGITSCDPGFGCRGLVLVLFEPIRRNRRRLRIRPETLARSAAHAHILHQRDRGNRNLRGAPIFPPRNIFLKPSCAVK